MNQICEIVQYAGALFDNLTMNLPTLITRIGIQINIVSKLNRVDRILAFRYRAFTLSRTRSMLFSFGFACWSASRCLLLPTRNQQATSNSDTIYFYGWWLVKEGKFCRRGIMSQANEESRGSNAREKSQVCAKNSRWSRRLSSQSCRVVTLDEGWSARP